MFGPRSEIDRKLLETLIFLPFEERKDTLRRKLFSSGSGYNPLGFDLLDLFGWMFVILCLRGAGIAQPVPALWAFGVAMVLVCHCYFELRAKIGRRKKLHQFRQKIAQIIEEKGDENTRSRFAGGRLPFEDALDLLYAETFQNLESVFNPYHDFDNQENGLLRAYRCDTLTRYDFALIQTLKQIAPEIECEMYEGLGKKVVRAEREVQGLGKLTRWYVPKPKSPIHSANQEEQGTLIEFQD